jgi:hypothetical protein
LGESDGGAEQILELCCNLDDMTPEALGFAQERLLEAGALDVYTVSIGMKKNRPAVQLCCLCREEMRQDMVGLMFRHTTTLGIREATYRRYTLSRTERTVETAHGTVHIKTASGWGVAREKAEYEDLARIARQTGMSIDAVLEELQS